MSFAQVILKWQTRLWNKTKAIDTEFPITYKEGIIIQNIHNKQVKTYRSEAVLKKSKQYSSQFHTEGDETRFSETILLEKRVRRNFVSSMACDVDTFCPCVFISGIKLYYIQRGKEAVSRQELVIQNALNSWTKII
ncbi:uncharacterized protein TNCT_615731 [Trichonephila clavata]|uniref:Uncharacterized protein n=1 Tax=Trichonephila clavata TaxID=2740835 RepID=A0A8X6G7M5_TRICU|nr:uncharacterized protein TNCT_615731 [Trichonephila clavata]